MDFRDQFMRPSSWMAYLSLLLMLLGRYAVDAGSARFWLMTAGTAALSGAMMYVLLDVRRYRVACAVRKNKAIN